MVKKMLCIAAALLMLPALACAQSYASLWKQADEAEAKDLPKTQIAVLRSIMAKADAECAHGHLLKAAMKAAKVAISIEPDSLSSLVEQMRRRKDEATDPVLRAVANAVLYRIYTDNPTVAIDAAELADTCRRQAMERPDVLAAARAGDYEPFVVNGYDSRVFDDDMLSVIGYEVEDFATLYDYYHRAGKRSAACMAALERIRQHRQANAERINQSDYIMWLDSLISVYADVDVACEAAIERYNYMEEHTDASVEDRISYIHFALDRWGGWHGAGQLRNAEKNLTTPCFAVSMERSVVEPGVAQKVAFDRLRNIRQLSMRVYRADVDGATELNPSTDEGFSKMQSRLTLLKDHGATHRYMSRPDYQFFDDSLTLGPLEPGVYVLEWRTQPSTAVVRCLYFVTNLRLLALPLPGNRRRFVALNATTGQPVPGAKITLRSWNQRNSQLPAVTLTCNADGEAIQTGATAARSVATVSTSDDRFCPPDNMYGAFHYSDNNLTQRHVSVFTDRKVYRPGQQLRVAAVAYEQLPDGQRRAIAGRTYKATLRDANYKVVAERDIVTDDYGTSSVDFMLPTASLGGRYTVRVGNSAASVLVEQYRRPTFRVELPRVNERYADGDTLIVRCKAMSFAGVPVQGATFNYTVRRSPALWWRFAAGNDGDAATVLWRGQGTTAADGSFTIEMPIVMPQLPEGSRRFYNFTATVDVTDMAGESHTAEMTVPLGSRPTAFSTDLPAQVLADSLTTVTFTLRNASGENITTDVRCRIDGQPTWLTGTTSQPISLGQTLASGRHSITALCESDTLTADFTVFSLADTVPCIDTRDWFYASDNAFPADGRPVTVQVGSSDSDVHILYSIIAGDSILESGALNTTNALVNRKFSYDKSYGNGLRLVYAWVKNGRCYRHACTIARPQPDSRLKLKWATFRDRLTPGQIEEWRLSVTTPDGRPANAQLMATLYDKALDEISAHSWMLNPLRPVNTPFTAWQVQQWGGITGGGSQDWKPLVYTAFNVSRFDASVLPAAYNRVFYSVYGSTRGPLRHKMMSLAAVDLAGQVVAESAMATSTSDVMLDNASQSMAKSAAGGQESAGGEGTQSSQMRENLNETAFFFPSLLADSTGVVTLRFTLPESLTTWRMLGIAHTADILAGTIEAEAVARKDVMIVPNVPRFVREGDRVRLTARVFNTTQSTLGGTARLELIDPATETTVHSDSRKFSVEGDSTAVVAFDFDADGQYQLLVCRVSATGATFDDGEQHYLPVLPARERVTVTAPFTLNGPSTVSESIERLFAEGAKQRKLTIEYTNNPAWLMVQALPYVATPRTQNAIDQCVAYYANAVGSSLIGASSRVKTVVDQWRLEQGEGQSLQSNLAKNAELRDILLDETPWIADADREEEQRRHLADFFDANQMQARMDAAADNLSRLQNADGSWSWYSGMAGSTSMTMEVAEMMVRLNAMAGPQKPLSTMLNKALAFADKQMADQVKALRRAEREGTKPVFPGITALRYLYVSSMSDRKLSSETLSSIEYLVDLLREARLDQSIYDKAVSAIVLAKHGNTALGLEYVKSLKEYTVFADDMGRYYSTPRAAYSWRDYRIPTQVAAMEAIAMITPTDTTTLDEMRRWLLRQKQTQAWDTPINSANAIYAFLNGRADLLAPQAEATLAIDGKVLELPAATAGLGYVKTSIDNPQGTTFTATKPSAGIAWGALYGQSMQPTARIEASSAGISIKRELIGADGELHVGDRVKVRITIEASRDYDFVVVTDRRAACMEPVVQTSGYRGGCYRSPSDNATTYSFDRLSKGTHVVESEYFIDRAGVYESGTCVAQCAYATEYRATAPSMTVRVAE